MKSTDSGNTMPGPLAGLRVLELTGEHAQFCGKLMADSVSYTHLTLPTNREV